MIKKFKPITPSLRHRIILKNLPKYPNHIQDQFLNKRLLKKGFKKTSGRNNQGIITSFRKGGGHKQSYRFIDHDHSKGLFSLAKVIRIEYNPLTSCNIVLLQILNSSSPSHSTFYRLAPANIQIGDILEGMFFHQIQNNFNLLDSSAEGIQKVKIGEIKLLKDIPIGTAVHDLSLTPSSKGKISRAAGTSCQIIKHFPSSFTTLVSFPTGQIHSLSSSCSAIIGELDNSSHRSTILGKAGASRWLGIRPRVRGEAMNAVDHPHGGKNHGPGGLNNQPRNRWGKLAKWQPKKSKKSF